MQADHEVDLSMIVVEATNDGQLLMRCDRVSCRRRGFAVARMPNDLVHIITQAQQHVARNHALPRSWSEVVADDAAWRQGGGGVVRGGAPCRRAWRRWWMGLDFDVRESICVELCMLPRGTASDDGWLRIDPRPIDGGR